MITTHKIPPKSKKLQTAFTLIELLVVISIIGILTAIILPNMMGMRQRARDSKRKDSLKELKTTLRLYYNDYQEYPPNNVSNQIVGCGGDTATACSWGESFERSNTTYINQLPTDSSQTYRYERYNSGESFRLWITLENQADQEISASQDKCSITIDADHPATAYYICND